MNRPEEISNIIKSQIKNYKSRTEMTETGKVILVGDGIARVYGLKSCMSNELLEFEDGSFGVAQNLEDETVSVAVLSDKDNIREGSTVKRTGKVVSVPVGEKLLGRVVNALGEPIDGKGPVEYSGTRPIESEAPGIIERESVSVPLQTGIKAIDSMIPIGRGQRELIIGDRQTGKTEIAIDTIINQKNSDVICIYVAIGQKNTSVVQLVNELTPKESHKFLTEELGITTLTSEDMNLAPLGMGGTNGGLTTIESAAAYAVFGNGGRYYKPTLYSKVCDQHGKVILEYDYKAKLAISEDTATE